MSDPSFPAEDPTRLSAGELAESVRSGRLSPEQLVGGFLARIEKRDPAIRAFQLVRAQAAREEARALLSRPDLSSLPLAGVPVAIKDNLDVAGEPTRIGSAATSPAPKSQDHEVVKRLRQAGAIVIGKTKVPELCVWATTDGAFGVTRNPWDLTRTPGGSSGGSAAAVAAGMVPWAQGNDGLGSIRIPAACCGLIGIKPGRGVVPSGIGASDWFGMAENGALATTAGDAALLLSVMAARPDLADLRTGPGRLRIALATATPLPGASSDNEILRSTRELAGVLQQAGHIVQPSQPPYSAGIAFPIIARWFAGVADDLHALELDTSLLEPRTRRQARAGEVLLRMRAIRERDAVSFRDRAERFFSTHDLLLTPALAQPPLPALRWSERSWLANVTSNSRFAPFSAPWNLAGFPAITVPAGISSRGLPLAVQFAGPPGSEKLLLELARELEAIKPWARRAPEPRESA